MPPTARICIVIPGSGNEFNNVTGNRVAEALGNLGATVRVVTPRTWHPDGSRYDFGVFVGLADIVFAYGEGEAAGTARLREIGATCNRVANWLLEPVGTPWFRHAADLTHRLGMDLLDYSLHSQVAALSGMDRQSYRHIRYGLTRSELASLPGSRWNEGHRAIPWCVVGHATAERVRLVERLVRGVHPGGFAYLPRLGPVTEGGPHLRDGQMQRVLERSRLLVWCSHFAGFYLEAERFRRALLAGCVPIKVCAGHVPDGMPFAYLLAPHENLEAWLARADVPALWERFRDDYLAYSTLEDELSHLFGLPVPTVRDSCKAA